MTSRALHVLLVEDNDGDALLVQEALEDAAGDEVRLDRVRDVAAATAALADARPDCVLLDLGLPDATARLGALRSVLAVAPDAAVVVLTGTDDDALAAEAIAFGAQDYLVKRAVPSAEELLRAVRFAAERARTTRRLRSTRDELAQFASLTAHDLRGPLAVVVGYADALARDPGIPADVRQEMHERIAQTANRMSGVVASMLNYAADPGADRTRVRVADVVEWLQPLVRHQVEASGGRLTTGDLEAVWANEPALRTVLLNLVTNALAHAEPGRPVRVHVSTRRDGDEVVVEVTDDGPGIPVAERERVFTLGRRLRGESEGIGLGLSAVRRTVLQLDGRVWFEDTDTGRGVRACVALPAVPTAGG